MSLKAAAAAFSVSPATAHRWWHRWLDASEEARATLVVSARSFEPSAPLAAAARARARRGDLRLPTRRRAGGRAWSPARPATRTRPSGRCSGGPGSRGRRGRAGAGQPLRVALPRRSAAHGHQRVRPLPAARPPRHRRPLKPGPPAAATASTTCTRSSTTTPDSPTPRSTRRPARHDRRRLPRARPRLLRRSTASPRSG